MLIFIKPTTEDEAGTKERTSNFFAQPLLKESLGKYIWGYRMDVKKKWFQVIM